MYDAGSGAANGFIFDNTNGEGFHFKNTTTTLMRMNSAGNVGINVTNPQSPLHIIKALGNDVISIGEASSNTRLALGQEAGYTGNYIHSQNIDLKFKTYLSGGTGGNIIFMTAGDGTSTVNERMRINSNGNIGIGTTSTPELVNINSSASCFIEMNGGTSSQTGFIFKRAGTAKFQWVLNNDDSLNAYNYMSGTNALRLTSGGNTVLSGASDYGYRLYVNGTIYATGNITANSDLTLKKNLELITNPTDKLMQLNGYSYQWKSDDSHQYGVIAQEVEKILPYAVSTGNDGIKGVSYNQIIPVLIEAVKEQKKELEELRNILASK
jgi:hypothetical protein